MEIAKKEFESIMSERGKIVSKENILAFGPPYFIELSVGRWLIKPIELTQNEIESNFIEIGTESCICVNEAFYDNTNGFILFGPNSKCFEATENQVALLSKAAEDNNLTVID